MAGEENNEVVNEAAEASAPKVETTDVEVVEPDVASVIEEPAETVATDEAQKFDNEPEREVPDVRDHDRDYFRQWLRTDGAWVLAEIQMLQHGVSLEERTARNV